MLELILHVVCTCAFYFMSNFFTYNVGMAVNPGVSLPDVGHELLYNLSEHVAIRDILLLLFFIPLFWVGPKKEFIKHGVEGFMYIITLKAITIFFTLLPPSNQECAKMRKYNHCFHQVFSGHNSLALLLCILYLKYLPDNGVIRCGLVCSTVFYSLFIIMTRAHYTVDVIVSYIIVLLLCT